MSITHFEGELPEYRSTLYNAGCFLIQCWKIRYLSSILILKKWNITIESLKKWYYDLCILTQCIQNKGLSIMKNYKDKYKLIVKLVITVVGIVFCAQTHLIFSEPWFGANSGVMDGLAAAEVISKTAILLFVFHTIITLFDND